MNNIEKVLEAVEKVLLSRQLSPVERLVLRQSWLGRGYSEMAQDSAYGIPHIKEVGSRLWHELSGVLGERVTKKNLHLVWDQYQESKTIQQPSQTPNELPTDTGIQENVANVALVTQTGWHSAREATMLFEAARGRKLRSTEAREHPNSSPPYGLTPVLPNDASLKDKIMAASSSIEYPSRPVPLDSPLYINRPPIEELVCSEISQPGCLIRIKAPRRMGKSSLLNRILGHGKAIGYKTVYLDFQEADRAVFTSLDKFLRWFCANVSRQLHLKPMLDDYWDDEMGSKVSCKIYFEGYLLKQINTPLVLALNEVNQVFEHTRIAQDFLPMLRFWHEQARAVESWQKLRLLVVHSTEIYIPLKLNQSPFNVGLSIKLPQLSLEQVQDLAQRYGLDWRDGTETQQLMAMVGGHPYLVNVAFYHLCREEITLEKLLLAAATSSGIYSQHLLGYLAMLREEPQLSLAMQQVVTADESVPIEAIAAYKLESMGLIHLDGNQATPSCELYRLYFREQLELEFGQI